MKALIEALTLMRKGILTFLLNIVEVHQFPPSVHEFGDQCPFSPIIDMTGLNPLEQFQTLMKPWWHLQLEVRLSITVPHQIPLSWPSVSKEC